MEENKQEFEMTELTVVEAEKPEEKAAEEWKPNVAFIILSIIFPLAGLLYWLINHKKLAERAVFYCKVAVISTLVGQIVSIFFTVTRVTSIVGIVQSILAFFGIGG